jgi:hypothetical protein
MPKCWARMYVRLGCEPSSVASPFASDTAFYLLTTFRNTAAERLKT